MQHHLLESICRGISERAYEFVSKWSFILPLTRLPCQTCQRWGWPFVSYCLLQLVLLAVNQKCLYFFILTSFPLACSTWYSEWVHYREYCCCPAWTSLYQLAAMGQYCFHYSSQRRKYAITPIRRFKHFFFLFLLPFNCQTQSRIETEERVGLETNPLA